MVSLGREMTSGASRQTTEQSNRLNPKDGSTIDKIEIPMPHPEPHGMTRWDGCFWYCDATSGAICRLSV